MKYISKVLIAIVAFFSLNGCEDMFDDIKNYGGVPADGLITSVENAQIAVNGAYSGLYGLRLFRSQIYYYLDFATNELEYRHLDENIKMMTNYGYNDGSAFIGGYWKDLYGLVARSNDACSKMYILNEDPAFVNTATDDQKAELMRLIGECNFLRGLGYFYLTRSFGDKLPSHPNYNPNELGVPIVDTLVVNKEQLYKSRNTLGECWTEVIRNFKTAYELLPESWGNDKLGAATKGAAAGYLGQVYMYLEDYKEAKKWFEESMKTGKYELMETYAHNFDLDHENNPESIFEVQFQTITSDVVLGSYMWRNFGPDPKHWGTVNVSMEYVNKFRGGFQLDQEIYDDIIAHPEKYILQARPRRALQLVAELAFKQSIGSFVLTQEDLFDLYTGDWDALATEINTRFENEGITNFDIKKDDTRWGTVDSKYIKIISSASEKNTDPRMYDSFYIPNRDSISYTWNVSKTEPYSTNYYGFKKYIPYNSVDSWSAENLPGFDGYNSINQRIFRLGDMYLQYAEACYREGDQTNATEYLNKVRRRAWGYPIHTAGSPVDFAGGDFMDELIAEREKELCLEGHLWFDYLRLNKAEDLFGSRGFNPKKHHRLPIPLKERQIVGMNKLLQNDGY
ncbi:RagB/SusD family nutrient uptake outer membrane protein [Dysgonomonas sp. 520]|uniref:RagB/SusD family nutrient uptake outer membrane protein n=1 Tax=Dysgonomonas sp. 520 TaxID=2302931 RepID=UPI0013D34A61|nr:RagB/SusD family nutrient uptake outer membrane protein [Dysgonomonas sp. 520]NDW08549.1 RagB/SusD family nutrient uptake outer membrane protein [Dysgonomonas sp. 520]